MSRHTIDHPSKSLRLVYGFDSPLGHFFFEVHDTTVESEDYDDSIVESSGFLPASRGDMADHLSEFGLESDHPHVTAVVLDLPIE